MLADLFIGHVGSAKESETDYHLRNIKHFLSYHMRGKVISVLLLEGRAVLIQLYTSMEKIFYIYFIKYKITSTDECLEILHVYIESANCSQRISTQNSQMQYYNDIS